MKLKQYEHCLPPYQMPSADGPGELPEVVFGPMPMMMGGPEGPGGPPGGPGGPNGGPPKRVKPEILGAIYICDGQLDENHTQPDCILNGSYSAQAANGIEINSSVPLLNGIYVKGSTQYEATDINITLSGNSTDDFSGIGAAVMADEGATVVLRNAHIVTNGVVRTATVATNESKMYVYDSYLATYGGTLPADYIPRIGPGMLEPPAPLGIQGTARTNLTMENSESYFYDSTIFADGWGALSTDSAKDRVYLEANRCTILTKSSGYGAYADGNCHDVFRDCSFDCAAMTVIIAGKSDVTFTNCISHSKTNFAMMHCVMGMLTEVSELAVQGGTVTAAEDVVLVKSANSYISFCGSTIHAENGILVHSVINDDPSATRVHGDEVYGVNVALRDMTVTGSILHEDTERTMAVSLEHTDLTGAIRNAFVKLDAASHWTASDDSLVILVDTTDTTGIDAPNGVTIFAVNGSGSDLSGSYTLRSGGTLHIL